MNKFDIVYLVCFKVYDEFTKSWKRVYKIGHTRGTIENRFKRVIKNREIIDFEIIKNIKVEPIPYIKGEYTPHYRETELHINVIEKFGGYNFYTKEKKDKIYQKNVVRFHNFYLKKNINGITEIRTYDDEEIEYCKTLFENSEVYER